MEKKNSMLDLLSKKSSNLEVADAIAEKVHTPTKAAVNEGTTRISIDTPHSVYLQVKTFSTVQKIPLKDYILNLMREDIKRRSNE